MKTQILLDLDEPSEPRRASNIRLKKFVGLNETFISNCNYYHYYLF